MKAPQLSMIDSLYAKDNVRLAVHKRTKTLYNYARFVYSRVEELPSSDKKISIVNKTKDLVYDIGAAMVIIDPDGDINTLKEAYKKAETLGVPERFCYVYPTIEKISELVHELIYSIAGLLAIKRLTFTNEETSALGEIFNVIDSNVIFLKEYFDEKENSY